MSYLVGAEALVRTMAPLSRSRSGRRVHDAEARSIPREIPLAGIPRS